MFLKSTKWTFILSLLLIAYLAVVLPITASHHKSSKYPGYRVDILDPADTRFVTSEDIRHDFRLDSLIKATPIGLLNLPELAARISAMDEIETASIAMAANGNLIIRVIPMIPVARVFEKKFSYYINSRDKRMPADMKYHLDVPIVINRMQPNIGRSISDILPLLKYISDREDLNALVSDITLDRRGNIFIRPVIRGHIINFGDTTDVKDKFDRLMTFYRKVSSVKGWDYYDTISVKWRGQVVAHKNITKFKSSVLPEEETEFDFIDDDATMTSELLDSINPDRNNLRQ